MDWQKTLPVIVSIMVIIAVAILRNYSKNFAAIAAVMPMNIPLGMWIVYAGAEDKQATIQQFNSAILINFIPTIIFMLVVWQGAKAGWSLAPMIAAGYVTWGVSMGVVFALRQLLG